MLNIPDRLQNFRRQMKKEKEGFAVTDCDDFSWGKEVKAPSGCCLYHQEDLIMNFSLPQGLEEDLLKRLELVYGIGPVTANKLRSQGTKKLSDLAGIEKWQVKSAFILEAIYQKKWEVLKKAGAIDYEILMFFRPEDFIVIDIETTGLSNTLPLFLVGLLQLSEGKMRLHQFLARDFQEEKPLLEMVKSILENGMVLVSFNGKAFDWPYLKGRYTMHRLPIDWEPRHLDLLPPARRCYRGKFQDCRLKTLEQEVLQLRRIKDVPGEMIPVLYHEFVKTGDFRIIKGIIEHNKQDLLSMVYLLSNIVNVQRAQHDNFS